MPMLLGLRSAESQIGASVVDTERNFAASATARCGEVRQAITTSFI